MLEGKTELFPQNDFIAEHDRLFPKREIDLKFEALVTENNLDTLEVISTTARLITRVESLKTESFKDLFDYIVFRMEREEFSKALYYAYTALVGCLKDSENQEKQQRKNKILDYIALCAEKMKE